MKKLEATEYPAWTLSFSSSGRSIHIELRNSSDGSYLEILFAIDQPTPVQLVVFEIFENEEPLAKDVVVSTLAEHILYMVDLTGTRADTGSAS
jgi:hypothetical protein